MADHGFCMHVACPMTTSAGRVLGCSKNLDARRAIGSRHRVMKGVVGGQPEVIARWSAVSRARRGVQEGRFRIRVRQISLMVSARVWGLRFALDSPA